MRFHFLLALFVAGFHSFNSFADEPKKEGLFTSLVEGIDGNGGWLQLFDSETTFGWSVTGDVRVDNKSMILGAKKAGSVFPAVSFGSQFEMVLEFGGGVVQINGKQIEVTPAMKTGTLTIRADQGKITNRLDGFTGGPQSMLDSAMPVKWLVILNGTPENPLVLKKAMIRPINSTPLFDGKSLTGWKRFTGEEKREKSKFIVTKNGELQVANGPGDLQTETSFRDFCLQFECKTNGTNLNSGFFFRCLPGQYQQGYEAQIHNGYHNNDRTKPTDFGTGAIYRRIASRKVVANDEEWFSMTVLAVGPRLCTWVNGYPTANWMDEREMNANARNGKKLDGGPISIQGHDPTTDILFRKIQIVEIGK